MGGCCKCSKCKCDEDYHCSDKKCTCCECPKNYD